MSTKFASDGDVHSYFSPYKTPHDAFIAFMNVVDDFARRLRK
jgi:alpha-amylase